MRARATVLGAALGGAILVAAALPGCGGGGGGAPTTRRGAKTPRVGVLVVPTRDLVYSVEALGTLEAYQVVVVPSRLDGVVEKIGFEEGASVTTESELAVIDGSRRDLYLTQAEHAVSRAKATVERAEASVARNLAQEASARAALEEAQGMLTRREEARAKNPGIVASEEIETVRATVEKARAALDQAVAATGETRAAIREAATTIEEAKAREAIARRDVADSRIRPPLAGVAQARHVAVGQWVRAGEPVATLVDTSRLRLRFRVPEEASATLVPGKVVIRFRTASLPGKEASAALLYVQSSADPQTRMVECLAEVASPDPALKPGFFANVIVDVHRAAAAPVVPEESARATERGLVVYVIADGKAKESKVRLGLRSADGWVEVVEGLAAGATIAVENAWVLGDGKAVETFPSKRAATAPPAAAGAAGPGAPATPPGPGK